MSQRYNNSDFNDAEDDRNPDAVHSHPGDDVMDELQDDPDIKNDDNVKMEELKLSAKVLEEKLEMFGIFGKVVSIKRGPVVTLFEYNPKADSKFFLTVEGIANLEALNDRLLFPSM